MLSKEIITRLNTAIQMNDVDYMRAVLYDVDEETDLVECNIEYSSILELEDEIFSLLDMEE